MPTAKKSVQAVPDETPAESTPSRDDLLRASYQTATKRLREEFASRFNEIRVEEAKALGIEWTPPKSAEQKAEEEMARLVEKFPHLADKIREGVVPS